MATTVKSPLKYQFALKIGIAEIRSKYDWKSTSEMVTFVCTKRYQDTFGIVKV